MAVLIEGISVVIKAHRVIEAFKSWNVFCLGVPNKTMCCDNEVVRIGFMSPIDVHEYIQYLNGFGLVYLKDGKAIDIAVADQIRGLCCECSWLIVGTTEYNNDVSKIVCAAQLKGTKEQSFMVPEGWKYEESLTKNHKFIETAKIETEFQAVSDPRDPVRTMVDKKGVSYYIGRVFNRK